MRHFCQLLGDGFIQHRVIVTMNRRPPRTHTINHTLAIVQIQTITPDNLTKVFFTDSGSVAVESALKIALQYWHNKGEKNKQNESQTTTNSYHQSHACHCPNSDKHHRLIALYARLLD
jgi:adenosylmethionine-8-amino-7-oxononanoate aminotransferase